MEISGCTTLIQSGNGTQSEIATAFYDRGVAYMEQGNNDQAMGDFEQAIRLRANFPLAFYNVGVLYQARGEDDRSIQMFTTAISFKPDFAEAFNNRAVAYNNKKEYDLALRDADQAIRLRPDYAKAFLNRGAAEVGKGDDDEAIQNFDQAIRLKADFLQAFVDRGVSYTRKTDYTHAIEDFNQAIRLDPGNADVLDDRCWVHGLMNRSLDDGMSDCNESLRLKPNSADALGARGLIYLGMAQYREAIASCTAGLDLDPKSAATLYYVRGIARLRSGDHRGGEEDIAAAKTRNPKIIEKYAIFPGMQPPEPMFKLQEGQEKQQHQ
jgi:tetratricopeptide (TPR) repeat protein